jgi:signal transduction histidine kinase
MRSLLGSTIFRITGTFALILIGAVFCMGGFTYWSTVGFMERQTNTLIETDIEGLADVYRSDGLPGLVATIKARIERDPARSSIYLVADRHRTPVVGNISSWPHAAPNATGWIEFQLAERDSTIKTPARTRPFLLRGEVNILVGRDMGNLEALKWLFEHSLLWAMGTTVIVGSLTGMLFTRRVEQRLEMSSDTSRGVMQGNLARRVPILDSGDDLDKFARGFNAMLDEIQQLLSGIEHASDNIAHDLRTPLSRLRNRLAQLHYQDLNLQQKTLVDDYLSEVDQLLATFGALLRIAKLEATSPSKSVDTVDMKEIVLATVEFYEPLAHAGQVQLRNDLVPATVRGERDLLLQAVCNLIDNALKFSARGGTIEVRLTASEEAVSLRVSDSGIGLDSDDADRVFERFFRGRRARDTQGGGHGLSLVKAICTHHGAEILLADNEPGVTVKVNFP